MHNNHNKIVDYAMKLADNNNITKKDKKDLEKILKKYDIDVNYDNSIMLAIVCSYEKANYKAVRYLLELGADPNLIMDHDNIVYDMIENGLLAKTRLDGIFRSFGYECLWVSNGDTDFIDMNQINYDQLLDPEFNNEDIYDEHHGKCNAEYNKLHDQYRLLKKEKSKIKAKSKRRACIIKSINKYSHLVDNQIKACNMCGCWFKTENCDSKSNCSEDDSKSAGSEDDSKSVGSEDDSKSNCSEDDSKSVGSEEADTYTCKLCLQVKNTPFFQLLMNQK